MDVDHVGGLMSDDGYLLAQLSRGYDGRGLIGKLFYTNFPFLLFIL